MWQAQVLQRRHGRMRPADGRTMRPDCHLFSREMGLVHGSAWARRVSPPSRQPHPDGLGSKGPTWTRTRNPVSASSRHEPSILGHRKLRDRSVWRRSPRAMTSRAQCGEACLSSRQAAGPVFTTMESRLRSPMFLLGRVLCAGESEEVQRRGSLRRFSARSGVASAHGDQPVLDGAVPLGGREKHTCSNRRQPA